VIGAGLSQVGRVPGRSPLLLAADAARRGFADAGIRENEIDGVRASSAFASPFHRFSVAISEYLGIQPTFSNTLQASGATAATMFNVAAAAIVGGLAETVLVVGRRQSAHGFVAGPRTPVHDREP
jgi:acetyl-CoA acetyltransferase